MLESDTNFFQDEKLYRRNEFADKVFLKTIIQTYYIQFVAKIFLLKTKARNKTHLTVFWFG